MVPCAMRFTITSWQRRRLQAFSVDPFKIFRQTIDDGERHRLRHLVGMDGSQLRRQCLEQLALRLDQEKPLALILNGILPSIDASYAGYNVDADSQLRLYQCAGHADRFFFA